LLWRSMQHASHAAHLSTRAFGKLSVVIQHQGNFLNTGDTFPLKQITSLGRSPSNAITIDDTFTSSEHALIVLRGDQWWLEDRDSRNGTTLNGIPIRQPVVVTNGDIIGVGTRLMRLDLDY
jgi:hypothetical protein